MANLKLNHITKRFGKNVLAVKDVNLEVHDGEFLVLLGPSGCGKTTTLRMIAGLEEVTKGRIIIDEDDITNLPPWKRNMSMIFQSYAVWPHMTVYQNIAYALKLKGMSKKEIDKIVKEVAEMTDISIFLERYPNQLSGGQRQRVAVARAVAVKPRIFLMDEPLSNLDAILRVYMRTELKEIHKKTKATTIFVTHDQSEAMSLADRIVIMKDGEIVQTGTTDEVYHNSKNMFVANFIGAPPTNFTEVTITIKDGKYNLVNPDFKIILNDKIAHQLKDYNNKKMIIGVRPENIMVVDEKDAIMSVKCLLIEPQGSHQVIIFKINGKIAKLVVSGETKIKSEDTFFINFKQEKILFFDYESHEEI